MTTVFGVDHSPWTQAVMLAHADHGIAAQLQPFPSPSYFFKSGLVMPVCWDANGHETADSLLIIQSLMSDTEADTQDSLEADFTELEALFLTYALDRIGSGRRIKFIKDLSYSGQIPPGIVRLIKLLRLLRSSRILRRIETKMTMRYSTLDLVKCGVYVVTAAHWSACCWGLLAAPLFVEDPMPTWLGYNSYCVPAASEPEAGLIEYGKAVVSASPGGGSRAPWSGATGCVRSRVGGTSDRCVRARRHH